MSQGYQLEEGNPETGTRIFMTFTVTTFAVNLVKPALNLPLSQFIYDGQGYCPFDHVL